MVNPNNVTERLFRSPSKYVQGPYAIQNEAKYLGPLGKAPLLICDDVVWGIAGKDLVSALEKAAFKVHRAVFGGESTREEIARIAALARAASADFVIALGGGKTSDTAKTVAADVGLQVAVLPTTASTDAPCSAIAVLYRPEGVYDSYRMFDRNPAIVLVDTTVVAKAPPRFLAAGMGDALATNVEARACRTSTNCAGGLQTEACRAVCERCEEVLFRYGRQAYEANRAGVVTPALEAVVEANTLLSGLGFESGGVAAAHAVSGLFAQCGAAVSALGSGSARWRAEVMVCLRTRNCQIHNGMTAIEGLHGLLHGEKVAFGTICQLVLDGVPASELDRYIEFLLSVDLPVTFELLGIPDVKDEQLRRVAELACAEGETVWAMDRVMNVDFVAGAMKAADAAGHDYMRRKGWKRD